MHISVKYVDWSLFQSWSARNQFFRELRVLLLFYQRFVQSVVETQSTTHNIARMKPIQYFFSPSPRIRTTCTSNGMLFSNHFDTIVHGFAPKAATFLLLLSSDINRHVASGAICQPVKLLRRFSLFHSVFWFCMMPRETNFDQRDWRESAHCSLNSTIPYLYSKLQAI